MLSHLRLWNFQPHSLFLISILLWYHKNDLAWEHISYTGKISQEITGNWFFLIIHSIFVPSTDVPGVKQRHVRAWNKTLVSTPDILTVLIRGEKSLLTQQWHEWALCPETTKAQGIMTTFLEILIGKLDTLKRSTASVRHQIACVWLLVLLLTSDYPRAGS